MTDLEEEQPTQNRGRRDWNDGGQEETSLTGDELADEAPLVPDKTQGELRKGRGDANPGGTLQRSGESSED